MKRNYRELKVGFASLIVLALFYWGFGFLKGRNVLSSTLNSYYVTYSNISGLQKSSQVSINGFSVGKVLDIYFNEDPKHRGELIVESTVEKQVYFSKNSIVKIASDGIMGGKSLVIVPSYQGDKATPGDYLKGEVSVDLFSKLDPLQVKMESAISSIEMVAKRMSELLDEETITELQSSIKKINTVLSSVVSTSQSIDVLVKNNDDKLNKTLSSVEATSYNLKAVSDSLAKVKILSISQKINKTVANLEGITSGIATGEGSLGKLAKDEDLYNNLEAASKELEELLRDMKEHPKRFVHFSLFGKKEKKYKKTKEN